MRLLLIEDNAPLRNAVGQFLREAGFILDTAETGDEDLWAASENPYDAIFLYPSIYWFDTAYFVN